MAPRADKSVGSRKKTLRRVQRKTIKRKPKKSNKPSGRKSKKITRTARSKACKSTSKSSTKATKHRGGGGRKDVCKTRESITKKYDDKRHQIRQKYQLWREQEEKTFRRRCLHKGITNQKIRERREKELEFLLRKLRIHEGDALRLLANSEKREKRAARVEKSQTKDTKKGKKRAASKESKTSRAPKRAKKRHASKKPKASKTPKEAKKTPASKATSKKRKEKKSKKSRRS